MKHFTSKTVEEAVQAASKAVNIPAEQLIYKVIEEKKGLFGIGKEATIEIYDIDDAAAFAEEYLKTALGGMGVEVETSSTIDEDIIHVNINSERNPILIGKGGRTLQA
ncbi:MAG: Jag N-terminal domain-containing protein, partial [Bacilli bacterium]|nr:Jag N-terminal domain-containing protein [Bacilli bacterium]